MLIFVKPKDGVTIKRPDNGRILSADGEEVPKNTFWRRRIGEGDVDVIEAPRAAAPAAEKSETASVEGDKK